MKSILLAIVSICLLNFACTQQNITTSATLIGIDYTETSCSGGMLVKINGITYQSFDDLGSINGIFNIADIIYPLNVTLSYKHLPKTKNGCVNRIKITDISF
jgi:hypothetical protein